MAKEYILKDRHGNSRTFDKETFYVRGADGELMPFTHGTGNPVLQPLTITENGTYTAPAGVDGYNPVTVEVDPTKVTILRDTTITGFVSDADYGGLYAKNCVFGSDIDFFEIEEGQEYLVLWDNAVYSTVAKDASAVLPGALFLGNGSAMGLEGNGEPFAIGCTSRGVTFFGLTDPAESHTVGIWQEVKTEIKLQDKTITENGEYTADEGFDGLGKVLVDIMQSATTGEPLYKSLYFQAKAQAGYWVDADIGFKPDIIFLYLINQTTKPSGRGVVYMGFSQAFADKLGTSPKNLVCTVPTGATFGNYSYSVPIERTKNDTYPITGADETGFYLGCIQTVAESYSGFAIGGLS